MTTLKSFIDRYIPKPIDELTTDDCITVLEHFLEDSKIKYTNYYSCADYDKLAMILNKLKR